MLGFILKFSHFLLSLPTNKCWDCLLHATPLLSFTVFPSSVCTFTIKLRHKTACKNNYSQYLHDQLIIIVIFSKEKKW